MTAAIRLARVLVVADSDVLREMLRIVLSAHADEVRAARDLAGGLGHLDETGFDLVVCDVTLTDGDGFALVERASAQTPEPSRVILVTAHPREEEAIRARALGAIGYLAKPIAFRDLASVLRRARGPWNTARAPRRRSDGHACLIDAATGTGVFSQLCWPLRDLSRSGAFIETDSPIPVGTRLELALELGGFRLAASAEVVRVQDPDWGRPGGVGVSFVHLRDEDRSELGRWLEGAPETLH